MEERQQQQQPLHHHLQHLHSQHMQQQNSLSRADTFHAADNTRIDNNNNDKNNDDNNIDNNNNELSQPVQLDSGMRTVRTAEEPTLFSYQQHPTATIDTQTSQSYIFAQTSSILQMQYAHTDSHYTESNKDGAHHPQYPPQSDADNSMFFGAPRSHSPYHRHSVHSSLPEYASGVQSAGIPALEPQRCQPPIPRAASHSLSSHIPPATPNTTKAVSSHHNMPLNEPSFHHPTIAWHVQQQQQQQAFWAERHLDHQSIHGLEALDVRHSKLSSSTPIASSVLLSTPPSMSIIRVDSDSSPQILQQQCQQQQQSTQLVTHDAITQQQHAQQQQAQQQQLQMDHTQHQLHFQRTIVQQPQSEGTASFSGQQLAHVARLAGTHMVPTSTDTDPVSFDGRAAIYPPDRSIHDVPNNTSMSRQAVDNSTIMAYFESQPMPSDDGSGGAFSSTPPPSLTDYALMGNNNLALVSCNNNNNNNNNNNSNNNINNGAALYLHDAPAHGPNFVLARDMVPPDVQHGMHHLVEQHLVFEQQQQQHASGGNAIMQAHMPETAAGAKFASLPFEDGATNNNNNVRPFAHQIPRHIDFLPSFNPNDMQQAVPILSSPACSFQDALTAGSSTGTHSVVNTPTSNHSFYNSHQQSYFSLPLPIHGNTLANFSAHQQKQHNINVHHLGVTGAAGPQTNVTPEMPSLTLQGPWAFHALVSHLQQPLSSSVPPTPPPLFFQNPSRQAPLNLTSFAQGLPFEAEAIKTPAEDMPFPAPPSPATEATEMPPPRPAAIVSNASSSITEQSTNAIKSHNSTTRHFHSAPITMSSLADASTSSSLHTTVADSGLTSASSTFSLQRDRSYHRSSRDSTSSQNVTSTGVAARRRGSTSMAIAPDSSSSSLQQAGGGGGASSGGKKQSQFTSSPPSPVTAAAVSRAFTSSMSVFRVNSPLPLASGPGSSNRRPASFSSSSPFAPETSSSPSSSVPKSQQPPSSLTSSPAPSSTILPSSAPGGTAAFIPPPQLNSLELLYSYTKVGAKVRPNRTASLSSLTGSSSLLSNQHQQSSSSSSSSLRWSGPKRLPTPSVPGGGCFALSAPPPRLNTATKPPPMALTTLPGSMVEFGLSTLENVNSGRYQAAEGMERDDSTAHEPTTPPSQQQQSSSSPTRSRSNQQQRCSQEVEVLPQQVIDMTLSSSSSPPLPPSPTIHPSSSSSSSFHQHPFSLSSSSSSSAPQHHHDHHQQDHQQPPRLLNSYMLYRRSLYWKHLDLFKNTRASGADISRAVAQAWRNEPPEVKLMFEYEAELERARQQEQPLVYQYRKRKSETMLTGSTGGEVSSTVKGKGKGKAKAAKTKVSSTMGGGSASTQSGSGSGSGSGLGSGGAISSSSSLGFSLMALSSSAPLSSSLSLSLSSSSPRLVSVPERNAAGQVHTFLKPPGQDSVTLSPGTSNERGNRPRGLSLRTKSTTNISTTAAGATAFEASENAKTRQRSKSEGGVTVVLGQGTWTGQVGSSSSQTADSKLYATNSNGTSSNNQGSSSLPLPTLPPVIPPRTQHHQHLSMFSMTPIDPCATTMTTGTSGAIQSLTSPRSRSSSKSSSTSASSPSLPSPSFFQMQAAGGAPATALSDGGAFATMRICEDDGSCQDQDDVIMSYHQRNQSHFVTDHHQEGEGEGEGNDGHDHDQNDDDAVALREDQVPIKKHKSRQPTDHHKK